MHRRASSSASRNLYPWLTKSAVPLVMLNDLMVSWTQAWPVFSRLSLNATSNRSDCLNSKEHLEKPVLNSVPSAFRRNRFVTTWAGPTLKLVKRSSTWKPTRNHCVVPATGCNLHWTQWKPIRSVVMNWLNEGNPSHLS